MDIEPALTVLKSLLIRKMLHYSVIPAWIAGIQIAGMPQSPRRPWSLGSAIHTGTTTF